MLNFERLVIQINKPSFELNWILQKSHVVLLNVISLRGFCDCFTAVVLHSTAGTFHLHNTNVLRSLLEAAHQGPGRAFTLRA